MKKTTTLLLSLAGLLLTNSNSFSSQRSYADVAKTTAIHYIPTLNSTYHLIPALYRKRQSPTEAYENYKKDPVQAWKQVTEPSEKIEGMPARKPGTESFYPVSKWNDKKWDSAQWKKVEGPSTEPDTTDLDLGLKSTRAKEAAKILQALIDPLHAKHLEYVKRKEAKAKKQQETYEVKVIEGNGKAWSLWS